MAAAYSIWSSITKLYLYFKLCLSPLLLNYFTSLACLWDLPNVGCHPDNSLLKASVTPVGMIWEVLKLDLNLPWILVFHQMAFSDQRLTAAGIPYNLLHHWKPEDTKCWLRIVNLGSNYKTFIEPCSFKSLYLTPSPPLATQSPSLVLFYNRNQHETTLSIPGTKSQCIPHSEPASLTSTCGFLICRQPKCGPSSVGNP